ncbi:hypothetical protein [Microtetraspora sp. NBRC 16547]|uniref:hypothetical protein n=1 Tax=Microtetraspora sp. NBRC 16547 TaxID=3030993 RepID=UPI0024A2F52C|nr:hypothetical protein [Microtetraspora sp. NBRC 16547]GLX01550.1 hypothetical protein Misp02_56360 [Microtetraspora sp. NBRC 16547]
MKNDRRLRRLVDGDTIWLWSVRQKLDRNRYENCRLTLSLWREGSRSRLSIVFRPGPDRVISNTYFEAGTVVALPERDELNLYEPKTIHRLLQIAAAREELPMGPGTREIDGWHLFEALMAAQNAEA